MWIKTQFDRRFIIKGRIFLLLGICILLVIGASAQGTNGNTSGITVYPEPYSKSDFFTKGSQMTYFEKFLIEKRLELILQENIMNYFHPDLFFVSVNFENEDFEKVEIQTPISQTSPASAPSLSSAPPPLISRDEDYFLDRLPALPQYRRNPSDQASVPSNPSIEDILNYDTDAYENVALNQLRNLRVHFILDPLIELEMEDLFRKLTLYSLKMPDDGTVQISFERYPLYGLFADLNKNETADSLRIGIDFQNKGDQLFKLDRAFWDGLLTSPWSYLGLALLVLLLLFAGDRLFGKREGNNAALRRQDTLINKDQDLGKTVNITKNLTEIRSQQTETSGEATTAQDFSEYFVKHTAEIGKVFSYWLEDLKEEGLSKVHAILRPMGKNVYVLVYPYLSAGAQEILVERLADNLRLVADEEWEEAIKDLMRMIDLKLGIDSMAFISSLSKEELFGILDQMDSKYAVLAFEYLDKGKVTAYMEHVPIQKVMDLIVETNKLKVVSRDEFSALGLELSKKLAELRMFKKYSGRDIKQLLESFEDIDLDRQYEILNRMLEWDLDLYQELKKSILMWADIGDLDKELVRSATQDFSARDLSLVHKIKGAEIKPVLDLRPEREQLLIYEMSAQIENVPIQEAEAISKRILKAIHTKMKENEI